MKRNSKLILFSSSVFAFAVLSGLLYGQFALFRRLTGLFFCPFLRLTGYPCATCGLTRCILHIGSGNIREAFLVSPLFFLVFLYLGALLIFNSIYMLRGSDRCWTWLWNISPKGAAVFVLCMLLASWVYKLSAVWFWHLAP